jgi:hypothetical protein
VGYLAWKYTTFGWQAISPSMSVERYTPVTVGKDLPNRNTGRAIPMLVHFLRREIRCAVEEALIVPMRGLLAPRNLDAFGIASPLIFRHSACVESFNAH